jgi:hypothetical protein
MTKISPEAETKAHELLLDCDLGREMNYNDAHKAVARYIQAVSDAVKELDSEIDYCSSLLPTFHKRLSCFILPDPRGPIESAIVRTQEMVERGDWQGVAEELK